MSDPGVKFIRVRGRIIPIRGSKPKTVRITVPKHDNFLRKVAAGFTATGGTLLISGRNAEVLGKKAYKAGIWSALTFSSKRKSMANIARAGRVAKRFGPRLAGFGSGLIVAGALVGAFSTFKEK